MTVKDDPSSFLRLLTFYAIIIDKRFSIEYDGPSKIVVCLLSVDSKNLQKNQKKRNNLDKSLRQFSCIAFILF